MGIRLSYGKNSPCEKCEDKTTVNWAQLSNEYRANESSKSGDSSDLGESGDSCDHKGLLPRSVDMQWNMKCGEI